MIRVPNLNNELLQQLGREVGGCDFTSERQREFLSSVVSCDVQAAPGNGKTTLLVAKLALLSRAWTSRTTGVCVISHTNAARLEVERKLAGHPSASAFLSYPHFVGTVTTFVDQFVALPYLRGLGWNVRRIDDEMFEAIAKSKIHSKATLRATAHRQRNSVETWVSKLQLTPDFQCEPDTIPARLSVRKLHRQPGAATASGRELEELKAELTRDGYFRFGDMTAIASQALDKCPVLIDRLRERFPLVILDEAQDTQGQQFALLKRLFGQGVAFQLLGDQNQTLYDNDDAAPEDFWQPAADAIPLNETRRFGPDIAGFASRLTVRKSQVIEGKPEQAGHRCLILFDRPSIDRVLPAYVEQVLTYFAGSLPHDHETWAVASRHNLYRPRGNWPKSLVDYHPQYRSGSARSGKPQSLCAILRQAALKHSIHAPPADVANLVGQGFAELLRLLGARGSTGERPNPRNIWRVLASDGKRGDVTLRLAVFEQVLQGVATWDQATWNPFITHIATIVGFEAPAPNATDAVGTYLAFDEKGADAAGQNPGAGARTSAVIADLKVQLGSIHSVKGRTVNSILIVETEVYKGQRADEQAMDLATVLPHAFGIETREFAAGSVHLAAATNVFVGATRARSVLALAMRKEAASAELIRAAEDQRWIIQDITRSA